MKFRTIPLLAGIAFIIAFQTARAQSSLWTNLVAYWPLDTATAISTPDVAIGNDLILSNAPTLAAGERNDCFQFNGTSQFLGLVHSTSPADTGLPIYYSTNGYTIAFWVNGGGSQGNNKTVFSEGNLSNSGLLMNFATQAGKMRVLIKNDAGVSVINNLITGHVIFDNTWHHVAWVDDHGNCQLYVDGNLDTPTAGTNGYNYTYTSAGGQHANDDSIGALYRATPLNFFKGSVDEVMLWNRPLSQAEVQTAMTDGIPTPVPPTPPVVTVQPSDSTNNMGDLVTFSGHIYGSQPMSYQWLSNDVPLPDQTNNTLTLAALTSPGTNFYSLIGTNIGGSITSNPAMLIVLPDAAPSVSDGLISYWPFDTVSTSPTTNSPDLYSQDNMMLNFMDGGNLVPGQFGNALSFDGATQYGNVIGGTPIYDLSTTYTVAFWVKGAAGQADKQVFANGNSTNGNYFFIGTDNTGSSGKVDVRIQPGMSDTLSAGTAFDGTWHHIVWVDQNGAGLLYIDGVLDPTAFNYARGSVPMDNTTVGALLANPLRDYFGGDIDDVGVWSRRLSYTEIQSIIADGIPTPPASVKPIVTSFTTQPADTINNIYQGDTVSFTVLASGTPPLSYQWLEDGAPISGISNPTALTNILIMADVQPADSGLYSVIVTNAGGSVTSSVVQMTVTAYTPVTSGTALQVDFNAAAAPAPQPGFSSMTLNGNPATFNGPQVALSPIGATSLTDRTRATPVNNPPNLTQANIYDQFIFSSANTAGTGINILINRLAPNTPYELTLWSFDQENQGLSDWTEVASGEPSVIQNGYSFNGSILPTADNQDTMTNVLISSSTGQLEIQGVVDPASTGNAGVFVNALTLVANPQIAPQITRQPQSASAIQGSAFTNTVAAWGTPPLAYQWYQNGTAVPGQTNASLIFDSAQTADAGAYYVVITNIYDTVTSGTVTLTVYSTPAIVQAYTNMILYAGAHPTFSVAAAGVAPLNYQWSSNGIVIAGATNASYIQSNLQSGATNYTCIIGNSLGFTTNVVSLTILPAPTAPYPQSVLTADPMGYWRLNEPDNGSGNDGVIANDYWGGNEGIYNYTTLGNPGYNPVADPTDTSAGFGLAGISFSDNDAYNITGIDFGSPTNTSVAFSIEAWVNGYQQTQDAGIVAKGYGNGGEQFDLDTGGPTNATQATPHNFRFLLRDASGKAHVVNSSIQPEDNSGNPAWHHLVGVCDEPDGVMILYIDGQSVGTAAVPTGSGILTSTNLMAIGSRLSSSVVTNYDSQFVGYVNDVAVYDYALTANQVAGQYIAGGGVPSIPFISIERSGGNIVITYTGTLLSSTNVVGPYNSVAGATSPYTNAPSSAQMLYRASYP